MAKKTNVKMEDGGRAAAKPAKPARSAPTREQIEQRAYEIYLARGKTGGRELEDWVQAERELSG